MAGGQRHYHRVALESTGNYSISSDDLLEAAGIEVFLVNARHLKGVPGKRPASAMRNGSEQLHAAGLLRKNPSPPTQEIVAPRCLMRHRAGLIAALKGRLGPAKG